LLWLLHFERERGLVRGFWVKRGEKREGTAWGVCVGMGSGGRWADVCGFFWQKCGRKIPKKWIKSRISSNIVQQINQRIIYQNKDRSARHDWQLDPWLWKVLFFHNTKLKNIDKFLKNNFAQKKFNSFYFHSQSLLIIVYFQNIQT